MWQQICTVALAFAFSEVVLRSILYKAFREREFSVPLDKRAESLQSVNLLWSEPFARAYQDAMRRVFGLSWYRQLFVCAGYTAAFFALVTAFVLVNRSDWLSDAHFAETRRIVEEVDPVLSEMTDEQFEEAMSVRDWVLGTQTPEEEAHGRDVVARWVELPFRVADRLCEHPRRASLSMAFLLDSSGHYAELGAITLAASAIANAVLALASVRCTMWSIGATARSGPRRTGRGPGLLWTASTLWMILFWSLAAFVYYLALQGNPHLVAKVSIGIVASIVLIMWLPLVVVGWWMQHYKSRKMPALAWAVLMPLSVVCLYFAWLHTGRIVPKVCLSPTEDPMMLQLLPVIVGASPVLPLLLGVMMAGALLTAGAIARAGRWALLADYWSRRKWKGEPAIIILVHWVSALAAIVTWLLNRT